MAYPKSVLDISEADFAANNMGAAAPAFALLALSGTTGSDDLNGTPDADEISGGEGSDTISGGAGNDLIYGSSAADVSPDVGAIVAENVATGLSRPVFAASPPGDPDRLFIIEQHTGAIKILDLDTGIVLATPFLDINDAEFSKGGEQGLLGLAFAPDYAASGKYYVNLTNAAGDIEVWQYTRGANPDVSATTRQLVITFDHPDTNHNGGWMDFGPDGYLYIATGDGGGAGDPNNNAQNVNSLLGKILRIDVTGDDFPSDATRNYAIPDDNPFVNATGADEVFAIGLRNPWRMSFDSLTGDVIIGDVGQGRYEEIDFVSAGDLAGSNFGWRVMEGDAVFNSSTPGNPPPGSPLFTDPIYVYGHDDGPFGGVAVTGGYVLRGPDPGGQGVYVFGDFASGNLWTMRVGPDGMEDLMRRNDQIEVSAGSVNLFASFAVDGTGRLYTIGLDGEIHRLTFEEGAADAGDQLFGGSGDDTMYGGIGDDRLDGGADADTMAGGVGNDIYVVSSSNDVVIENASAGIDTVQAGVSRTLGANFENLVLLGTSAINGTGNGAANILVGNAGANTLRGMASNDVLVGAAGADQLNGGDGSDTASYVDATARVRVNLTTGAGRDGEAQGDTLTSIERVLGTDFNDLLTGSSVGNVLSGGRGVDILDGRGGVDLLTGGASDDIFVFSAGLGAVDTIADFTVADDTIRLDDAVFTGLAPGALSPAAFRLGASAADTDDRIIYDSATGFLYFDRDGSNAAAAIHFANLDTGLALTDADFFVV